MQFEFGGQAVRGRKPPTLQLEGVKERTVKVGESTPLCRRSRPIRRRNEGAGAAEGAAVPPPFGGRPRRRRRRQESRRNWSRNGRRGFYSKHGSGPLVHLVRCTEVRADPVKFDPALPFKIWEDQRGGSPWSPGFQVPPIPPGNKMGLQRHVSETPGNLCVAGSWRTTERHLPTRT